MKQKIELKLIIANLHEALGILENTPSTTPINILLNENRYRIADLKDYSEILLHSIKLTSKIPV